MILAIRISGLVEMPRTASETLVRMRLRRKYSAVLLQESPENQKLLENVRNFVAYGTINDETLSLLIEKRALPKGNKKFDVKTAIEQLKKRGLGNAGMKLFFRLHPPKGGIDSKIHFPLKKGVLGNNGDKINELVRRMI